MTNATNAATIKPRSYSSFMEALFRLPQNSLNSNTVTDFPAFIERCRATTQTALTAIPPRTGEAVQKFYGLDRESLTLAKVAADMSISSERVRQIISKGLRLLYGGTAFDQLALELHEQGHTSHHLLIASSRAHISPDIAAFKERIQNHIKTAPEVSFLVGHKIGCHRDNPCPTCRAKTLFISHGIVEEMENLLREWHADDPVNLVDLPINVVFPNLSIRTSNSLRNENLFILGDLMKKTQSDLLSMSNFGRKSLNEIIERLQSIGLTLQK